MGRAFGPWAVIAYDWICRFTSGQAAAVGGISNIVGKAGGAIATGARKVFDKASAGYNKMKAQAQAHAKAPNFKQRTPNPNNAKVGKTTPVGSHVEMTTRSS